MKKQNYKPKGRWASDVIVDLLHRYELPYAALNPGASYRGLHDSMVNYDVGSPSAFTFFIGNHVQRSPRTTTLLSGCTQAQIGSPIGVRSDG